MYNGVLFKHKIRKSYYLWKGMDLESFILYEMSRQRKTDTLCSQLYMESKSKFIGIGSR